MLSGLQQLSPMPCQRTTGVGSDDEKDHGDDDDDDVFDAFYGDNDDADIRRQRGRVIPALTWRELGLAGI